MASFTKFLLARDRLGHKFSLNYKGDESHKTWLGTSLSLFINILVLIILVEKTEELFLMRNPTVQVYTRPIFLEEV